jgi:drug/metabolite transporter (DMT)-like permease
VDATGSQLLLGQAACLSAASLWAVALMLFRRPIAAYGARRINMAKCVVAALLQGVTVVALGHAAAVWSAPVKSLIFIATSGLVGLVLGDTALFGATARIGVHRALLLQTLAPVFTAIIAAVWQAELPTGPQVIGGVVILAGVALVVAPDRKRDFCPETGSPVWSRVGIALGVVAALGQGAGLVLAKAGMQEIPVLPASFLRLGAAAIGLVIVGAVSRRRRPTAPLPKRSQTMLRVLVATFFGTYLALFLMMAGVALAPASIAAVLLSTSPVFSLILEAVVDRRPPTLIGVLGTLMAVAGVGILSLW